MQPAPKAVCTGQEIAGGSGGVPGAPRPAFFPAYPACMPLLLLCNMRPRQPSFRESPSSIGNEQVIGEAHHIHWKGRSSAKRPKGIYVLHRSATTSLPQPSAGQLYANTCKHEQRSPYHSAPSRTSGRHGSIRRRAISPLTKNWLLQLHGR